MAMGEWSMKTLLAGLLAALLAVSACCAEDMEIMDWSRPTPAPTATPAPTPEPVMQTGEILDSWEEILAAIDDGTAERRYAVGAWKPLDLGALGTVNMQLAGFGLDDRANGRGKAETTWIAREALEARRMNPAYDGRTGTGAVDGWETCELRAWLQDAVVKAIPPPVRARLLWVDKTQDAYGADGQSAPQTTLDNLWIPSLDEVIGGDARYADLFGDPPANRVRRSARGSAAAWWLRSSGGEDAFHCVSAAGNPSGVAPNYSCGVVLGFCL